MKTLRIMLAVLCAAAVLTFAGQAQAYDPVNRDAGAKIRGDYYPGENFRPGGNYTRQNMIVRQFNNNNNNAVVRRMPTTQNNVVAPAPQVAVAPSVPAPNSTAQADNGQRSATRTFSVQPNTQSTNRAPMRTYRQNRGWNTNANRKILGEPVFGY